ncbi:MAG: hypothetical protein L6R43_16220 [Planctomycetes bacterium]|nr:hypothetical protein [Planctomycetota bacterium]
MRAPWTAVAAAAAFALVLAASPAPAQFDNPTTMQPFADWVAAREGAVSLEPAQEKALGKAVAIRDRIVARRPTLATDLLGMAKMLKALDRGWPDNPAMLAAANAAIDNALFHILEHATEAELVVHGHFDADGSNSPPEARKIENYVMGKWGNNVDRAGAATGDPAKRAQYLAKALQNIIKTLDRWGE